ncbi:MAG TPA: protein kinase [Polyangiaceae bacterium]
MSEDTTLFELGELVADTYEIRGVLGEGGMGRVYLAQDLLLNRRVALKASWPTIDPALLQKEAQAIASIRHPGMIEVYAAGTHRGIAFLVMEYLYGVNLASFLEKRQVDSKPLEVRETLDVLIPVADALAAVHRAGIVHRDVKPANIMLTPNGRIVLMDFGLFQPENLSRSAPSGTPEYMAPESLQGDVDPRNAFFIDVYALGITAYELLTGEVPFLGDSAMATISQHIDLEPTSLREVRPDVGQRLAALVHEMLAKDPLERPPSMEAVAFRLRAAKDNLGTSGPQRRPQPQASVAVSTPSVQPTPKFGVLVVDDDQALAKLLSMYTLRAVPEALVTIVGDADAALSAVRDRAPDVMLVDLHMPRINGIELCMMLRGMRLADHCTIVAVSAGAREGDIELLRQLGITRFVPKGSELSSRLNAEMKELYHAWQRGAGAPRFSIPAPPRAPSPSQTGARPSSTPSPFTLLRQLARLVPEVMVVVFDKELRLLFAEAGSLARAGKGDAETLEDVVTPEKAGLVRGLYEAAIQGESGEIELAAKGRRFRVEVTPVRDDAGGITGGMAVVRALGN